jgi:hypothetical protein
MVKFKRLRSPTRRFAASAEKLLSQHSTFQLEARKTGNAKLAASSTRAKKRVRPQESAELTTEEFNLLQASRMLEDPWREHIRQYAALVGFGLMYHTNRSDRSDPGWPDDVLANWKSGRLVIIEAKRQVGVLTTTQVEWLDMLAHIRDVAAPAIEVYGAVRPLDSDLVLATLSGLRESEGGMHQWCLDRSCMYCTTERKKAKVVIPGRQRRKR